MPLQSYLTLFCAEESNKIQIVSEEHGLGPQKASVQNQAPVDDTPVGAGRPQQIARAAALLAKPEDSQYPERYQLVVQDGPEKQHAAEEGGCP